jgi:hypothetical protein
MTQSKNGGYGNITYGGNGGKNLDVDANPNTLGELTMTSDTGDQVQCFWDGVQWVCTSISFAQGQAQGASILSGVAQPRATTKPKVRKDSKSRKK